MQNDLGQSAETGPFAPQDERAAVSSSSFTNFSPPVSFGNNKNTILSYFVGVNANVVYPQSIAGDDRNLGPRRPNPTPTTGFSPTKRQRQRRHCHPALRLGLLVNEDALRRPATGTRQHLTRRWQWPTMLPLPRSKQDVAGQRSRPPELACKTHSRGPPPSPGLPVIMKLTLNRRRTAMTLIELIVVIAVIGVLASMLLLPVSRPMRQKSRHRLPQQPQRNRHGLSPLTGRQWRFGASPSRQ